MVWSFSKTMYMHIIPLKCYKILGNKKCTSHNIQSLTLFMHAFCHMPGFDLCFWSAVVKSYAFAALCLVRLKTWTSTDFRDPLDNIFLTVTENKFIFWNYRFSGPINIHLFKFNNNNCRIKCKICSKF